MPDLGTPAEWPLLTLEDIWASYGKKEVLRGLTFSLSRGEIVALLGGNGSGKSTMLKVISGILRPAKGKVMLGRRDITGLLPHEVQRLGVGYLLQGGRVFPSLTVAENLAVARHGPRPGPSVARSSPDVVFPALAALGRRRAGLLSGGERQMLAIQMALTRSPQLLLLDEPSAGLAPGLAVDLLQRIVSVAREGMLGVLLVEQNVQEAMKIVDRSFVLVEGRVRQEPGLPAAAVTHN